MGNLSKTILFIFALQFCSAQNIKSKYPSIIIVEKDTLVCFTTEQSKQIAVWNEQRKECIELSKNDNQTISELEKIKTVQEGVISNLENEIVQYGKNISDKNKLILICKDEKDTLSDEVRKQKVGKWVAIIGGIVLSTLCLKI